MQITSVLSAFSAANITAENRRFHLKLSLYCCSFVCATSYARNDADRVTVLTQ
jgi:hypothetical protein